VTADFTHGGDRAAFQLRYGRPPLDFSASLNPLGMPPGVAQAIRQAVRDSASYPDPFCRELAGALAARLGVSPRHLVFGNGAADLIHRLVQATRPRLSLLAVPAFGEYAAALAAGGGEVRYHQLAAEKDFQLGEDFLACLEPGIDMVFLANPNNPTGQLIDPVLLGKILSRTRRLGTRLVIDQSFLAFTAAGENASCLPRLKNHPQLVVLDSFTKLYAMAGIRLGYAATAPGFARRLWRTGPPWAVSTPAQAAGLAALAEDAFVERSRELVARERQWLIEHLERLGISVIGSQANYLFFPCPDRELGRRLAERGILVRDCRDYRGLTPGYWRVSLRRRGDNRRLWLALRDILAT
jgi:threonine-phosphate decarboxylase